MNSKDKGNISEARALFEFQKMGIPVLIPWGDNLRYDLVIELKGKFFKVQVKTANEEVNGGIVCYTRSSTNHTTNKKFSTYENDVDYFVFYNQIRDIIAIVPIQDIGNNKTITLRIEPTKNNQTKNIKFFEDYSFNKILCVETLHEEPTSK